MTIHAHRAGTGPRAVLLHGGPGLDHRVLLPLAETLAPGREILLPDLPGHGRSAGSLPDLAQLVEGTARWISSLDPPVELLVGHSLGAWIARELVRCERVRPRFLVLISPPARAGSGTARRVPGARRDRALRNEWIEFCVEDAEAPPSPAFLSAMAEAKLRAPAEYGALQSGIRRALGVPPLPFVPPCPVLVLVGERDRVTTLDDATIVARATGRAPVRVVAGAGHVPSATHAETVAAQIEAFVRESSGRS